MPPQEDCFPRGGAKTKRAKADTPKEINLFNTFQDNKKVKAKKSKAKNAAKLASNTTESVNEPIHSLSANVLTYQTIFEGMSLLGCIRKIKALSVEVELPGRVYGEIWVKSISQQYYDELNRKLSEEDQNDLNDLNKIFTIGQFLPVKVASIKETETQNKILLSTNPADINSLFQHKHLEKGMVLWGAVVEKSDHCYFINIGVKDSRVVLPFDKINPEIEYDIGQPFYSAVIKCESSKEATTLTVSALEEDIDNSLENKDKNLDHLIPGMQVQFNIKKILKNGLEGNILNNCISYINQMYLTDACANLNKFNVGDDLNARVLYIQPTTKFVFLTLRNLSPAPVPRLSIGTNEQATIVKRLGSGLLLKFKNNEKGFITFKRIIKTISNVKLDIKHVLNNKYVDGSKHTCRLLDYNRMDRVFICTFEAEELGKKILTKSNVKNAQIIEGVISKINEHGIEVQIENISGFIPNIHTSNSEFTKNIKNKYKEGQKIRAKVWNIDPNSDDVKLTIKQDLLNSHDDLVDYESIKLNKTYTGVVMTISKGGALVVFYGGVKGWLPSRNIPHFDNSSNKAFFIGQVIKCNVQEIQDKRITLTLNLNQDTKSISFDIGDAISSAKINHMDLEGLFLLIGEEETPGFLPWAQMCRPSLSGDAMSVHENGDIINELLCINNKSPITVSLSGKEEFESINFNLPEFKEQCTGTVVRGYFLKKVDGGIKIAIPTKKFTMEFFVKDQAIIDNTLENEIKFQPYQPIMAKVFPMKSLTKDKLGLSTKLSEVFSYDYNHTLDLLEKYLTDLQKIRAKNNILSKIKIGDKVKCVVKEFDPEIGCQLSLKSGKIDGFADIKHCSGELAKESKQTGIVLWVDYKLNKVILTLKSEIVEKIAKTYDEDSTENYIGKNVFIQILYVNEDCAVAVVNCKEIRGRIMYLPVRLHENDFLPTCTYYENLLFNKVKAVLQRNVNGKLLGVEKNIQKLLNVNQKRSDKQLKRKASKEEIDKQVVKKSKTDIKIVETNSNATLRNNKQENLTLKKTNKEKPNKNAKRKHKEESEVSIVEESADIKEGEKSGGILKKNKQNLIKKDMKEKNVEKTNEEKKRKLKEENEISVADTTVKKETKAKEAKNDKSLKENNKRKSKTAKLDKNDEISVPVLPGIGSFFNPPETPTENNSDSDENDEEDLKKKKKKKLTQAEKADLIQKEEERLRKIETELADPTNIPQTAEHFDRALLGNPDDSEIWLRYTAFHVQSTELDKARSVAKRALDKISYALTQERLNVWLAYLNLENMYGTKESFENIFVEAAKCNDALTVHLEAIKMLAEMQKYEDMEEKIKKSRPKFKQDLKMWLEIGRVYYKCKRFVDARKIKDAALKNLINKKEHVNLLVKFALMEMTLGEENHGEALFETILQSDPRRVDIWSTYVDQLVKNNKTDLARNVLVRAVGQKLAYKKMKTLFKKYLAFETKYGDHETVENVKEMLKEYVS